MCYCRELPHVGAPGVATHLPYMWAVTQVACKAWLKGVRGRLCYFCVKGRRRFTVFQPKASCNEHNKRGTSRLNRDVTGGR